MFCLEVTSESSNNPPANCSLAGVTKQAETFFFNKSLYKKVGNWINYKFLHLKEDEKKWNYALYKLATDLDRFVNSTCGFEVNSIFVNKPRGNEIEFGSTTNHSISANVYQFSTPYVFMKQPIQ
ncbi:hypothetical protein L596_030434 [Steinernema carpocapsae]|uniref:Uncharacterized protein n=1 Tax=Steinernema carpocapsae TaxID=34508 RepID=A0A4U5LPE8_STECR|nr:hypothetical protein L596_030434 [Steinernema carpocapsae]